MSGGQGRSPWFYVVLGCGGLVFLLVATLGTLAWVGYRAVKRTQQEMADPVARAERAARLLHTETLPEGYHSVANLSFPVVLDLVVLADRPPDRHGELVPETEHLFVYVKTLAWDRDWRDYAEGRADPTELLMQQGFRLDSQEELVRGSVDAGKQEIAFVAHRGGFETQRHGGKSMEGVATIMFIRCPDDKKMRIGIWTGPDPDPAVLAGELELAGTEADPERIRSFMSQFALCG